MLDNLEETLNLFYCKSLHRSLCCRQRSRQRSRSGDITIVDPDRLSAIRHKTGYRNNVADDLRRKDSPVHKSSPGKTHYLAQSAAALMAVPRTIDLEGR